MQCLCGEKEEGVEAEVGGRWIWTKDKTQPSRMVFFSPNPLSSGVRNTLQPPSLLGVSFKRRWKELEKTTHYSFLPPGYQCSLQPSSSGLSTASVPPELYSCFLEATAGSSLNQFDASSYSSSTGSSGIGSLHDVSRVRSRSPSSSRASRALSTRRRRSKQNSLSTRRKSPGTPIPGRRRSPSAHRKVLHSEVSSRGRSADPNIMGSSSHYLLSASPHSSSLQASTVSPSQRISRRKKKSRQFLNEEGRRARSLPTAAMDESSGELSSGNSSRRSRSSTRRTTASVTHFEGSIARAKSLGRLTMSSSEGMPCPPARRRRLSQHSMLSRVRNEGGAKGRPMILSQYLSQSN